MPIDKRKFTVSSISISGILFFGILLVFFLPKEAPSIFAYPSIMLFNLFIIASWIYCGSFVGIFSSLLSAIFIMLGAWSLSEPNLNLNLILALLTSSIGYRFYTQFFKSIRLKNVELEKIQDEISFRKLQLSQKRQEIIALEKRFDKFSKLKELSYELGNTFLLDEINKIITEKSFDLLGKSDLALLCLVDQDKQEIVLAHSHGVKKDLHIKFKKGDIFDGWVFKQRKPLLVEDIDKDFRFDPEKVRELERDFKSLISIPLIGQERLIGILRMESNRPLVFKQDDLRLLDILGGIGTFALENFILYKKTEQLAIRDGLTGLYVHRYFHKRLSEEIVRAHFDNSKFSLLMLDIDNFKDYNDKFGHPAGDIVLKKIADILDGLMKDTGDLVARYGGEEFAVVLIDKDKPDALDIARAICEKIASETFFLRRQPTFVTASIGLVSFPADGRLKDELIKKADALLYEAKKQGKNKVCYH